MLDLNYSFDDAPIIFHPYFGLFFLSITQKCFGAVVAVTEATDGMDALRVMTQQEHDGREFDCIFMDCLMPVMDGPTAVKVPS